jgi:cysteine-rich repeat protein
MKQVFASSGLGMGDRRMTHRPALGRLLFATLLLLGTKSPAAAIDMSGEYVVDVPCSFVFAQTGTTLQLSGSCSISGTNPLSASGTVDPVTGAFSVTGELTGVCSGLVISGTGDGEVFTATFTATSGICAGGGGVSGTKCSNGVIDPAENCEDGNHLDGDCCSARCILDAAGTTCTNDGGVCTDDVCNATGTCTHVANTSACNDGNPCTGGDVCAGGACTAGSPVPAGSPCGDDSNGCTDDVCNAIGTCTHVPNTNACNDSNPCTNGDVCTGGACLGSAAPAGQSCFSDSNACTDDVCNATGTCTHVGNTNPCDDDNACTSGDICTAGACVGSLNTDPCDDGNACSTGDVCTGGACVPTGVASECAGTINLTGPWLLSGPYLDASSFFLGPERDFIQTGAVLTAAVPGGSPGIGAVNPATGAFRANAPFSLLGECLEIIVGTATPHANEFSGTALIMCSGSITLVPPLAVTGLKCEPGQPCCGNGIVESGEVCDDQFCCDATCQIALDGTSCPDEPNSCTDDVCDGTGTCTHPNTPANGCVRDHYLCYKVRLASGQPLFTPVQKTLEDEFGTLTFDVKKIEGLCNPAQKNTEPLPLRPHVHAVDYRVSPAAGQAKFVKRTFTVSDQFGPHPVTLVKPAALLEPSAKALGSSGVGLVDTVGVDRFECYRTARPSGTPRFAKIRNVLVGDQFGTARYDLTKITKVCAPTNKNGEDPTAPGHEGHLVCYKAKRALGSFFPTLEPVSINNTNFGPAVLVARAVSELCVPALEDVASPTTSTTTTTTSTTIIPPCGESAPACNGVCGAFERCAASSPDQCSCQPIYIGF